MNDTFDDPPVVGLPPDLPDANRIISNKDIGSSEALPAFSFERLPGEKTAKKARADALRFTSKYGYPCGAMLSTQLHYMYREPLDGDGPEHRDDRPIDEETLRRCKQMFDEARDKLREMASLVHRKARLAIPHFVDSDVSWKVMLNVRSVVDLTLFGQTRAEPLSTQSVFLREWVGNLGHYILFVTGTGPVFFDKNGQLTTQRSMITELLQMAGWSFDRDEVDLVCRAVQRDLDGAKSGSSGLRASRDERAEAKAWRKARGLA